MAGKGAKNRKRPTAAEVGTIKPELTMEDNNHNTVASESSNPPAEEEAAVAPVPKEFSDNLKQLKFMSRPSKPKRAKRSSAEDAKEEKEAVLPSMQWQLPETTLGSDGSTPSIFNSGFNIPQPIVLRKGLVFAVDSDAVAELAMLRAQRRSADKQQNKKRRKRKDGEDEEEDGKFFIKQQGQGKQEKDGEDEDDDASSVDDAAMARHFSKQKKINQKQQQR